MDRARSSRLGLTLWPAEVVETDRMLDRHVSDISRKGLRTG